MAGPAGTLAGVPGGLACMVLVMTRQYVLGELSVRLEALQAVGQANAAEVTRLRGEAEATPPWALAPVVARGLGLAERMCWDSLARGDATAFARLAEISAELRQFAGCAGLLAAELARRGGLSLVPQWPARAGALTGGARFGTFGPSHGRTGRG